MDYVIIAGAWGVYAGIHSLLASRAITRRVFRNSPRLYRVLYNLLALVLLLPIYAIHKTVVSAPLIGPLDAWLIWCLRGMQVAGFGIAWYGLASYGWQSFIGSRPDVTTFIQHGAYRLMRHPLYFGSLLIIWSRELTDIDIVHNLCITAYFVFGIIREEKRLVNQFGEKYISYQHNVPVLWPTLQSVRTLMTR